MRADCHCDTALYLLEQPSLRQLPQAHQDLLRLNSCLDLAFMAIFIDEKENGADSPVLFRKVMDLLNRDIAANDDLAVPLLWQEQLTAAENRLRLLISAEGAAVLGHNGEYLADYFSQGLRSLGLSWNYANEYAGGCGCDQGLTAAGRDLIRRCEELGILIDCAHLNRRSFWQTLEFAAKPIIVSHTCCDALQKHRRNLTDEQLLAAAECGGVVGISLVPEFLGGAGDLLRFCEHIEYCVSLIGSEHVAFGTDFDGCTPVPQLAGIEKLSLVFHQLAKDGMSSDELENVGGNSIKNLLLRILPAAPAD